MGKEIKSFYFPIAHDPNGNVLQGHNRVKAMKEFQTQGKFTFKEADLLNELEEEEEYE